jgi:hypothetical protein
MNATQGFFLSIDQPVLHGAGATVKGSYDHFLSRNVQKSRCYERRNVKSRTFLAFPVFFYKASAIDMTCAFAGRAFASSHRRWQDNHTESAC